MPTCRGGQLRRQVRAAAAAATGEADLFDRLTRAGVKVKLRQSTRNPGQVTGYAVGLAWHTTAAGQTVWYGGCRLGPDLTLPKLRARWDGQPEPDPRTRPARLAALSFPPVGVWQRAERITRDAAAARVLTVHRLIAEECLFALHRIDVIEHTMMAVVGQLSRYGIGGDRHHPPSVPRRENQDG